MKSIFKFILAGVTVLLLASCNSKGSPAPAPDQNSIKVTPGDTSVTLEWKMQPNVQYWVYAAPGTGVSPQNCGSISTNCKTFGVNGGATSPLIIADLTLLPNLINGTQYSFSINGRSGEGPGGPGSASVQAIPRLAGTDWISNTPLAMSNPPVLQQLQAVAYGLPTGASQGVLVAAGTNGSIYSGEVSNSDGKVTWTPRISPVSSANFHAATYYNGQFLIVGSGGVILRSTDSVTWTQQTSNTLNDLYAISNYGISGFVATGASGTILSSGDGINWSIRRSDPSYTPLNGVTYGYNKYVAVGTAGILLTSLDAVTWTPVIPTSSTGADLKGVAYGLPLAAYDNSFLIPPSIGIFVAMGVNGTLVTSVDGGTTWATSSSPLPSSQINAVTYGHQFIAVDNTGNIFNSLNGQDWNLQTQKFSSPLYTVIPAQYVGGQFAGQYNYLALGAEGLNLTSK